MDRLIVFVLLAFLSIAATTAMARAPEQGCRPATSPRVTIETVQADIQEWYGRCVHLAGIVFRNRLLTDREAALEAQTALDEDIQRSIVIWHVDGLTLRRPVRVEILGRLGSCRAHHEATERYRQDHPDEIVWTSGYCHTSSENYIIPASIRLLSYRAAERLTEAEIPVAHRQLVPAPPGLRTDLVAAARAFATAVITGDESTFFSLAYPDAAMEQERLAGQPTPEWLTERRAEARRALQQLRTLGSPFLSHGLIEHEPRVLIERSELREVRPSSITICWCRGPDCTGRWPIMAIDADSARSRPYACVHASDFVFLGGRRLVQVAVEEGEDVFAEPPWPQAPRPSPST